MEVRNLRLARSEKPLEILEKDIALPRRKLSVSLDKPSASSGKKVTDKDLSKKVLYFYSFLCFKFLNFPLMFSLYNFSESEDLLRSYPATKFAEYRRDYAAKASISGRIACKHLIEQEKINKKLLEDSRKLSRDFKLSRARTQTWRRKWLNWLWP
jgi:hypothetical protein